MRISLMRPLATALAAFAVGTAVAAADGPVRIALTFDDLPAHSVLPPGASRVEVARQLIAALQAAGAPPVYGFVNGVLLEREPDSAAVLDLWRAAGWPLGNHTFSHPNLNAVGPEAFEADVVRNEPLLEAKMAGADWRWLRFPYLAEGRTSEDRAAVRRFLAGRGYHIASVTMSFDDYAFNEPYARCAAKGAEAAIALLEAAYLQWAGESLDYSRALSHAAFGRDIPYVLLMHEGAFDARMAPRLLALYRRRGAEFISLPEAERDSFYAADLASAPTLLPLSLDTAARMHGAAVPPRPWDPAVLDKICR